MRAKIATSLRSKVCSDESDGDPGRKPGTEFQITDDLNQRIGDMHFTKKDLPIKDLE